MGQAQPDNATVDLSPARRIQKIRESFEVAWQQSFAGATPPNIESFVAQAIESDRPRLLLELQAVEKEFQARWEQGSPALTCEQTSAQKVDTAKIGLENTIDCNNEPQSYVGATMDPDTAISEGKGTPAHAAASSPEFTIDQAVAGSSNLGATVGPEEQATPSGVSAWGKSEPVEGPTVAGFEILGELGRGGMGVVYKARQIKLNRMVALKMVLTGAHAGSKQLERFYIEAEAVARLQHPSIVQIYEVGEQNGLPFFSLEYVDGGCLADKIGGQPQPERQAAGMVETLALAMAFAHQHGIIHRDLKPANILLTKEGFPKITDFGLAKRLENDSSQTKSGTLMGTPNYMAPEQARGETKEIGTLADVYALGVILYEMLTGRTPFLGTSILDTLQQVRNQEPVPPSRLQPKIPRDLETICLKCLQKEPSKRYASAGDLAADLHRVLTGEPIQARPVGKMERAWRWCKRNPRVASLSAAVLVLLLTAGVSLVAVGLNMARNRQAASETRQIAEQRIEQATKVIRVGDYRRAQDLLSWTDPVLETTESLADVRSELHDLNARVDVFARFKQLLDQARFAGLFGSGDKKEAQQLFEQVIQLYDDLEQHRDEGRLGLPPLDAEQEQLFKEDVFDAFLIAGLVKWGSHAKSNASGQRAAAEQAIAWLNRAESLLPPTRVLYVRRAIFLGIVGKHEQAKADLAKADGIVPNSAVDHYWRGFADQLRGDGAKAHGNQTESQEHYRKAITEYAALLQLRPEHFWAYFDWAICHYKLGTAHDAIVGFTACIHLRPAAPWPYNNRGSIHRQLGQYDLALQDYEAAIERNSKYAEAYLNRGQIYAIQAKLDLALKDFEHAIEADPDYLPAVFERAETYLGQKKYDRAIADYDYVIQHNDRYENAHKQRAKAYLALGKTDRAVQELGQAIQQNPKAKDLYAERAEIHRKAKRPREAIADYGEIIKLDPADRQAISNRAQCFAALNQSSEAIKDYDRLIELRPKDVQAYFARGGLNYGLKRYQQARDDYSKVIQLQPKIAAPYRNRAVINLLALKDMTASLADWQHIAALQPKDSEAHFYIGLLNLGQQHYAAAIEPLEKSAALDPSNADTWWALAEAYHWGGKNQEALAAIGRTLEKNPPRSPESLNIRGDIYRSMGRLNEATADFQQLIRLKPDELDAYISLAMVYQKQGKLDEQKACYDQMVAANAKTAAAYLRRAEFRRDQGNFKEALADCSQASRHEKDGSPLPELVRASIKAASGEADAAAIETERLLKQGKPGDGHALYAAACAYCLASKTAAAKGGKPAEETSSRKYLERAMKLLAEVMDKGFHDLSWPEHNRMVLDPALALLRDQERAKKLIVHRP